MATVLYMHRGGTSEWEIPITLPSGAAKDLTGATGLSFLAKARIDDADGDAVITATPVVTDAAGGLVEVRLAPADSATVEPGMYVWGLQFTIGTKTWEFPDPSEVSGKLIVRADVVQA